MADYLPTRQNLKVKSTVELFNLHLNSFQLLISMMKMLLTFGFMKFHITAVGALGLAFLQFNLIIANKYRGKKSISLH